MVIAEVTEALDDLFTMVADRAARQAGWMRWQSKRAGATGVQTLTFGWLHTLPSHTRSVDPNEREPWPADYPARPRPTVRAARSTVCSVSCRSAKKQPQRYHLLPQKRERFLGNRPTVEV
jgi:hypothetical protein